DSEPAKWTVFMRKPLRRWSCLPGPVIETDGRILLGSDTGTIECLDVNSGRSLWRYVFPAERYWADEYSLLTFRAQLRRSEYQILLKTGGSVPLPVELQSIHEEPGDLGAPAYRV